MTHDEADTKARELNDELGARWDDISFYIAVESAPGEWQVQKRTEQKSWPRRILDAWLNSPG